MANVTYVASDETHLAASLGLIGAHNDSNVALALAAVGGARRASTSQTLRAARTRSRRRVPTAAGTPHARRERDASTATIVRYVDDGLATSVLPSPRRAGRLSRRTGRSHRRRFRPRRRLRQSSPTRSCARQPVTSSSRSGNAGLRIERRGPPAPCRTRPTRREAHARGGHAGARVAARRAASCCSRRPHRVSTCIATGKSVRRTSPRSCARPYRLRPTS